MDDPGVSLLAQSQEKRIKAARCRRLSRAVLDDDAAAALRVAAYEFEEQAESLEWQAEIRRYAPWPTATESGTG